MRAALVLLRDCGAVSLAPNQGYFLALDTGSDRFKAIELPESEEESIYRNLVRARFANSSGPSSFGGRSPISRATLIA